MLFELHVHVYVHMYSIYRMCDVHVHILVYQQIIIHMCTDTHTNRCFYIHSLIYDTCYLNYMYMYMYTCTCIYRMCDVHVHILVYQQIIIHMYTDTHKCSQSHIRHMLFELYTCTCTHVYWRHVHKP